MEILAALRTDMFIFPKFWFKTFIKVTICKGKGVHFSEYFCDVFNRNNRVFFTWIQFPVVSSVTMRLQRDNSCCSNIDGQIKRQKKNGISFFSVLNVVLRFLSIMSCFKNKIFSFITEIVNI